MLLTVATNVGRRRRLAVLMVWLSIHTKVQTDIVLAAFYRISQERLIDVGGHGKYKLRDNLESVLYSRNQDLMVVAQLFLSTSSLE